MSRDDGLKAAIKKIGVSGVARACGITSQAVSQWTRVPAGQALTVERASGVSRHRLRPDLYPRERAKPKRATPGRRRRGREVDGEAA